MHAASARFAFGDNWLNYSGVIGPEHIANAESRLSQALGDLNGKTFLEIGCGSGIHSLAAVRLGAKVFSFDYDEKCVRCTTMLKARYAPASEWRIERGSALDRDYLSKLGNFDIVYSWGVLHHTGDMWRAIELSAIPAAHTLMISLYADQGILSRSWKGLKRLYVAHPRTRRAITLLSLATLWGPKLILKPHRVIRDWKNYPEKRGMSPWHDVVDWAGGYPYETAKPREVIDMMSRLGFALRKHSFPRGIIRVNEFVFSR